MTRMYLGTIVIPKGYWQLDTLEMNLQIHFEKTHETVRAKVSLMSMDIADAILDISEVYELDPAHLGRTRTDASRKAICEAVELKILSDFQ